MCTLIDNRGQLLLHTHTYRHDERDSKILIITGCEFRNNSDQLHDYTNVICVYGSIVSIIDTKFTDNHAFEFAKVLNSSVSIIDSKFTSNSAGLFFHILGSVIKIDQSVFKHNHGSAISLEECTVDIL